MSRSDKSFYDFLLVNKSNIEGGTANRPPNKPFYDFLGVNKGNTEGGADNRPTDKLFYDFLGVNKTNTKGGTDNRSTEASALTTTQSEPGEASNSHYFTLKLTESSLKTNRIIIGKPDFEAHIKPFVKTYAKADIETRDNRNPLEGTRLVATSDGRHYLKLPKNFARTKNLQVGQEVVLSWHDTKLTIHV